MPIGLLLGGKKHARPSHPDHRRLLGHRLGHHLSPDGKSPMSYYPDRIRELKTTINTIVASSIKLRMEIKKLKTQIREMKKKGKKK